MALSLLKNDLLLDIPSRMHARDIDKLYRSAEDDEQREGVRPTLMVATSCVSPNLMLYNRRQAYGSPFLFSEIVLFTRSISHVQGCMKISAHDLLKRKEVVSNEEPGGEFFPTLDKQATSSVFYTWDTMIHVYYIPTIGNWDTISCIGRQILSHKQRNVLYSP